ncbi:hypothetical protein [Streptomyces sp. SHP 1-2]|uniref:hypothetical protein n=1 Tax=Streptomyces sp. SHP 1-2 TaxID=2769489 RepID=UPI0022378EEF|nr:hypothetical protein [Streptomyces sp. SHP 1-2]MCW5250342.1 hypothetical protein [Streptomyces sp. SHP 1-2]
MSTAVRAVERYLAEAADAGLVEHADGRRYVAGAYVDPLSNERQLLVEYCDEELLAAPEWPARLVERASALDPAVAAVVLRVPGTVLLPEPWERTLSYVLHPADRTGPGPGDLTAPGPGPADVGPEVPGLAIGPLAPGPEEDLVTRWLTRAMVDGGADRGDAVDADAAARIAREFLDAPDRRTCVARLDGAAVGHATLLCDVRDEVTRRRAVELVDILVDIPDPVRRGAVIAALTRAALAHAHRLGLPLLGHVVHPATHVAAGHGERIVASLLTRGWNLDHVFWRRSLTHDEGA